MKQNILLCTLGASWAVIPEVYGFLAPERLPLYDHHPDAAHLSQLREAAGLAVPDEVWVVTTCGMVTASGITALLAWAECLHATVPVRLWQADGTDGLASQAECERFRELLLRVCLLAHASAGGGQVLLSLAGGRKTMSADMQWAGSLLGCQALLHVVDVGNLPDVLRHPTPALMSQPLPPALAARVVPLISGEGYRSELLDVALDGVGPVASARFPIALAPPANPLIWSLPVGHDALAVELRRRERAGSQLLGNYLETLGRTEHHENWRSLYRLPPRVIEGLRSTMLEPALRDWLTTLPLADLHRHIGGCLSLADQREVAAAIWQALSPDEQQAARALDVVKALLAAEVWPSGWPKDLRACGQRCHATVALLVHATEAQLQHNLYETTAPRLGLGLPEEGGFARYELPGELSGSALLGHPAAHIPYARAIIRAAQAEGLAYLELRGSPQKYGEDGLAFLQSFHAALNLALQAIAVDHRPLIRFIVIADRRDPSQVRDVVNLALAARTVLPDFIAGVDLAGDEKQTRPSEIAAEFMPAFEACLPLTIHAGELTTAQVIWEAAYHLHADRIGHGLSLGDHPDLAARFRDRAICLELCPSSNREVVGYRDPEWPASAGYPEYPLRTLWQAGLPLTLCTDNPGISRTTLADEYLTAARMIGGLSVWEMLAMIKQGFRYAFLPGDEREALLKRADTRIYQAVLSHFGELSP